MIDKTITKHYEKFRLQKLTRIAGLGTVKISNKNPLAAIEDEEKHHHFKMKKLEEEMKEVFNKKVEEKINHLDNVERNENDNIERMRHLIDLEKAELFSLRAQFEREKHEWETTTRSRQSKSTESLGRKKHFRFSVGTLKFGKQ